MQTLYARIQVGIQKDLTVSSWVSQNHNNIPVSKKLLDLINHFGSSLIIALEDNKVPEPDDEVWLIVSVGLGQPAPGLVEYGGPYVCNKNGKWYQTSPDVTVNFYFIRILDLQEITDIALIIKLDSLASGYFK